MPDYFWACSHKMSVCLCLWICSIFPILNLEYITRTAKCRTDFWYLCNILFDRVATKLYHSRLNYYGIYKFHSAMPSHLIVSLGSQVYIIHCYRISFFLYIFLWLMSFIGEEMLWRVETGESDSFTILIITCKRNAITKTTWSKWNAMKMMLKNNNNNHKKPRRVFLFRFVMEG